MTKYIFIVISILSLALCASAQQRDVADQLEFASNNVLGSQPASNPFSLLDYSRIRWSHSYSISFLSGGAGSGSIGLWNSAMFYDLSNSLSLTLNLGVAHTGGNLSTLTGENATFVPGFKLDFHPSENFHMSVGFQRYPGSVYPYSYQQPGGYWLRR